MKYAVAKPHASSIPEFALLSLTISGKTLSSVAMLQQNYTIVKFVQTTLNGNI